MTRGLGREGGNDEDERDRLVLVVLWPASPFLPRLFLPSRFLALVIPRPESTETVSSSDKLSYPEDSPLLELLTIDEAESEKVDSSEPESPADPEPESESESREPFLVFFLGARESSNPFTLM